MKVYRRLWWTAVAGLLLIGLAVGWRLPPTTLLVVFLGSGSLCAVLILCLVSRHGSHAAGGRTRTVASSAFVAGSAAVSLAGYSELLGVGVLALVLFVALCSPVAVRAVRRGWRSVHRPSATRLEALTRAFYYSDLAAGMTFPLLPPAPCPLTDEQLSRGWRTSARTLRRRISPAQKVAIVEERQTYLAEFERRNPTGFAAWLTSGTGASEDLMPYLSEGSYQHATINWDELTRRQD